MTTILAYEGKNHLYIGADSGSTIQSRPVMGIRKVQLFHIASSDDPFYLGMAGDGSAMNQLRAALGYTDALPVMRVDDPFEQVSRIAYAVYNQTEPFNHRLQMVIAGFGHVWNVIEAQAIKAAGLAAVGSGADVAIGAASALMLDGGNEGSTVVNTALSIACRYDVWTQGPINTYVLPK